jgi:small subunit ribosomal protein S16
MAVVIRLSRTGKKGERKFRVVVIEKRIRRDGDNIEVLGWYEMDKNGGKKEVKMERYEYWLSQGALPSPRVTKIVSL